MIARARLLGVTFAFGAAAHVHAGSATDSLSAALTLGATGIERGEYVFRATGGCGCHTNLEAGGKVMAGGRPIETPFGTFYSTNITADAGTGIGGWSDEDFVRAMTRGRGPDGIHYYPVFPYTAFAAMAESDLLDLKAYLFSLPAVVQENRQHELRWPFSWRASAAAWQWLFFRPQTFERDASQTEAWNRGRYIVTALAHCQECHTPRTAAGTLDATMWLAGVADGPEGELAPNITPDPNTGIGSWTGPDMRWFLQTGLKPNGDDTQGLMSELIEHGYAKLRRDDLDAIATYLASLPAIEHEVRIGSDGDE